MKNKERKFFFEYYRKKNKNLKKGVIIAIDRGIIGWSMCDPKDQFSKHEALRIAFERALKSYRLYNEEGKAKLMEYYGRIPRSMADLAIKILKRSEAYYK